MHKINGNCIRLAIHYDLLYKVIHILYVLCIHTIHIYILVIYLVLRHMWLILSLYNTLHQFIDVFCIIVISNHKDFNSKFFNERSELYQLIVLLYIE